MRLSRFGTASAVALAAVVAVRATWAAPPSERWLRVASANFELLTTEKERSAKDAIRHFERVRSFFLQATRATAGTPLPVRIIGFRSEKEFEPFRTRDFAEAYYLGGPDCDYIVMRRITQEAFPAAVHEYMHLLVKHSGLNLPLWLNEGFAELFSTLKPVGGQVQVGALIPGRLQVFRDVSWIDLETFLAIDHDSPLYNEKDRAGAFYSQSFILTHMLFLSDKYRPKFSELLLAFTQDSDPATVFQRVYGKPLAAVQRDMERYLLEDWLKVALYPIKLEKSAEKLEGRPAAALESGLALANLLALLDKRQEAKQRYLALGREHPDSAAVEEALGYLELRAGPAGEEEAARHFARAAELGASNAKMYYDYAGVMHRTGNRDAVVPLLEKALELNPGYAEARYRLGFELFGRRRYKEALEQLSHFRKVTPDQACEFFQVLALTLDGLELPDRAIVAAKRAREYAKSPSEVETTERLIGFVSRKKWAEGKPAPAPDGDLGHPRLLRPLPPDSGVMPPVPVKEGRRTVFVLGVLRQFDCLDEMARLRLEVDGKEIALLISDPRKVLVKGSDEYAVDFTCGPQPRKTLLVEFNPRTDAKLGTAGDIISIEFKELRRRP